MLKVPRLFSVPLGFRVFLVPCPFSVPLGFRVFLVSRPFSVSLAFRFLQVPRPFSIPEAGKVMIGIMLVFLPCHLLARFASNHLCILFVCLHASAQSSLGNLLDLAFALFASERRSSKIASFNILLPCTSLHIRLRAKAYF